MYRRSCKWSFPSQPFDASKRIHCSILWKGQPLETLQKVTAPLSQTESRLLMISDEDVPSIVRNTIVNSFTFTSSTGNEMIKFIVLQFWCLIFPGAPFPSNNTVFCHNLLSLHLNRNNTPGQDRCKSHIKTAPAASPFSFTLQLNKSLQQEIRSKEKKLSKC